MRNLLIRLAIEAWEKPGLLVILLAFDFTTVGVWVAALVVAVGLEFSGGVIAGYLSTISIMRHYRAALGDGGVLNGCSLHLIDGSIADNHSLREELQQSASRFGVFLAKPGDPGASRPAGFSAFMMFGGFGSRIVVGTIPSNDRPFKKFILLHELGHMHPDSRHQAHRRALWLVEVVVLIFALTVFFSPWIVLASLPIFINRTYVDFNKRLWRIDSELAADTFALRWAMKLLTPTDYSGVIAQYRGVIERQHAGDPEFLDMRIQHYENTINRLARGPNQPLPRSLPLFKFQAIAAPVVILVLSSLFSSPAHLPLNIFAAIVAAAIVVLFVVAIIAVTKFKRLGVEIASMERQRLGPTVQA